MVPSTSNGRIEQFSFHAKMILKIIFSFILRGDVILILESEFKDFRWGAYAASPPQADLAAR